MALTLQKERDWKKGLRSIASANTKRGLGQKEGPPKFALRKHQEVERDWKKGLRSIASGNTKRGLGQKEGPPKFALRKHQEGAGTERRTSEICPQKTPRGGIVAGGELLPKLGTSKHHEPQETPRATYSAGGIVAGGELLPKLGTSKHNEVERDWKKGLRSIASGNTKRGTGTERRTSEICPQETPRATYSARGELLPKLGASKHHEVSPLLYNGTGRGTFEVWPQETPRAHIFSNLFCWRNSSRWRTTAEIGSQKTPMGRAFEVWPRETPRGGLEQKGPKFFLRKHQEVE
ncbi:uncharacterized protein LOC135369488 [Ornithodoros turicata]|uniref:uncharacterized protein LOC135369488 n=1 Tax=Ornithodoros turicata TaxID=34597 RepID=UPI003138F8C9